MLYTIRPARASALVEFLVEHFQAYPRHITFLRELHPRLLLKVLQMRKLTPEQIGLDYEALLGLIGEERALDLIGEERVLDLIGEERMLADLLRRKGPEWLRTMMERFAGLSEGAKPPSGSPTPGA